MQNAHLSQEISLSDIIKLVETELTKIKSNPYHKEFGFFSPIVDGLEKLQTILKEKSADKTLNLNIKIDTKSLLTNKIKSHSALNFAVMYCKAAVVGYLLDNGAIPDNTTIHHAVKGFNRDMDNVIAVLKAHCINLNGLNKKGETAMYKAVRKQDRRAKEAVISLKKYGASMLWSEKMKAPLLNQKERIKGICYKKLWAISGAGFHGC